MKVPYALLAAVLNASAAKDVRYYPNGVFFDSRAKTLVATNGHCIAVGAPNSVTECDDLPDFIMPLDFVSHVLKAGKKHVSVEIDYADGRVTGYGLSLPAVEGRYPDWRRVYAIGDAPEAPAEIDPEHLMRAFKAAKAFGLRVMPPVYQYGPLGGPVWVNLGGQAHFGIMPLRPSKDRPGRIARFEV